MSEEPPEEGQDQGQGEPGPEEPRADVQHLDSHSFPRHVPGTIEEETAILKTWVSQYLEPTWVYEPSDTRPWCTSWSDHPDAVSVLHAVYRAWQELIDTQIAGMSGPSTWIHHHLLPGLNYLRSPEGPFRECMRTPHRDKHALPTPVRNI